MNRETFDASRPLGRLCYLLVSLLVAATLSRADGPALTTITDTVFRANGQPASGTMVISWPSFTTRDNKPVAAGELTVTIGAQGAVTLQLAPNEGGNPAGSYYKVVYKLSDGTTATEYWMVPAASPTTIAAIRASVVPSSVAAQIVSRQYVDSLLQANEQNVVHRSGPESISGVKTFVASPVVPSPAAPEAAANKGYVDQAIGAVTSGYVSKDGDTMTGPLVLPADPVAANQAANRNYVDQQVSSVNSSLALKLGRIGDTPVTLAGLRFGEQFANLQAAVNDAGSTGALYIGPGYSGSDSYTNPSGIAVLDLRAGGAFQLDGVEARKIGNVRQCHRYPGADAGAKIAACIADLPATGGTADACGFEGAHSVGSTILVSKKTKLVLCGAQFTATATPMFEVAADLVVEGANRLTSTLKASGGGVIFHGSGRVQQFVVRNVTLNGNGPGSKALVAPNSVSGGDDWSAGRISLTNVLVQDFGDYAVDIGQSTYFTDISESLFLRNAGSVRVEWAADFTIKNSNFAFPAVNASFPSGQPTLKIKGGATFTVADSDFERNDQNNPTGNFQAADIWLEATSPAGAPGFGWIRGNKFGAEGETATRPKIQVASSAGNTSHTVHNVVITENSFYGAAAGGQKAIKIDNPINRFRITGNFFSGFQTVIDDAAALISSDIGRSVFDGRNVVQAKGGATPVETTALFTNGGRYFTEIAEVVPTADPGLPLTPAMRVNETPELRNRVAQSEALNTWSVSGVTVSTGQTDPFGTSRAVLVTAAGGTAAEQLFTTIDNTNPRGRMVLKFWAKAGTLSSVQAGIFNGGFLGAIPIFALGNEWKQYRYVYNGLPTSGTFTLRFYPGNGNTVGAGTIYLFGVQVSDFDSDYVPTSGTAVADTSRGSRFERKVEFANQMVSTVASGTAPLAVASGTKVTNLNADQVDGGDWASPGAIGTGTPNSATFTTVNAGTYLQNGQPLSEGGSGGGLPRPNTRRWSYVAATGSGTFNAIAEANSVTGTCSSAVAPAATDPAMTNCAQSSATVNTVGGISGTGLNYRTGRNISLQWTGRVRENASIRVWIGLTDQGLSTMTGSDNPAGNYAAFRFSTSAGDATVKCVTKDGTTQNIQASSLADLTAVHALEITEDVAGGKWHFYVDGSEVCGTGLSSNLPAANTNLRYVAGQQNLVSGARNIDTAWVQVLSDK